MILNLILVAVGILLCFFGVRIRAVCSAVLGFICGVLSSGIVLAFTVGFWELTDGEYLGGIVLFGIVCAVISVIYCKLCAAITGFLTVFSVAALIQFVADEAETATIIIISLLIAAIAAWVAYKIYNYMYIFNTALIGSFLACLGGFGLINDYTLEDVFMEWLWYGFDTVMVWAILGLAVAGFIAQLLDLKRLEAKVAEPA